jgi:hypothetical protein
VSRIGRPSPALIIALVSLFVSLSGVVYAAATIGSSDIKNNSIKGKDVRDDNLTGADIAEDTLGKVPLAAKADSATAALNATNAANANSADTATSAVTAQTAQTAVTAQTAQTANTVAPLGVTTGAIANQSIIGTKIKFPVLHEGTAAVLSPNGGTDTASASCGGGERMIGGGGRFGNSTIDPTHIILDSYPEAGGSTGLIWTVRGVNNNATTTSALSAWVVCIPDS